MYVDYFFVLLRIIVIVARFVTPGDVGSPGHAPPPDIAPIEHSTVDEVADELVVDEVDG